MKSTANWKQEIRGEAARALELARALGFRVWSLEFRRSERAWLGKPRAAASLYVLQDCRRETPQFRRQDIVEVNQVHALGPATMQLPIQVRKLSLDCSPLRPFGEGGRPERIEPYFQLLARVLRAEVVGDVIPQTGAEQEGLVETQPYALESGPSLTEPQEPAAAYEGIDPMPRAFEVRALWQVTLGREREAAVRHGQAGFGVRHQAKRTNSGCEVKAAGKGSGVRRSRRAGLTNGGSEIGVFLAGHRAGLACSGGNSVAGDGGSWGKGKVMSLVRLMRASSLPVPDVPR